MTNCKNCGKPVESVQGRRQREFCDNKQYCRNQWHNKNKKKKDGFFDKLMEDMKAVIGDGKEPMFFEFKPELGTIETISPMVAATKQETVTVTIKAQDHFPSSTEPKENTMAFFNKYGVMTWVEVEEKIKK